MTVETEFGKITATMDALIMLAHYMDKAAFYYEGDGCIAMRATARECSSEIYRAVDEYRNRRYEYEKEVIH